MMPVIGLRAEMAGKPGEMCRRLARHVDVDGDPDQKRTHHVAAGFEDDGDGARCGLQLVGTQIGKQAAHQASVVGLAGDLVVLRRLLRGFFLRILRFPIVCHVRYPF